MYYQSIWELQAPKPRWYPFKLIRWQGWTGGAPVLSANHILGPVKPDAAQAPGLPEGIPVVAGSPDLMAAAVGSGAIKDYETHLYIGTSSWSLAHVPFKKADILRNMASLPSGIPGRYLVIHEQETAGASLNLFKDILLYFEAIVALKYYDYDDIPKHIAFEATYEPNSNNHDLYEKRYKAYLKFYQQNRKVFRFLNA